jgi:hypothetical protein
LHQVLLACACAAAIAGCGDGEQAPVSTTPTQATVTEAEPSPLRQRLHRLVARLLAGRGLDSKVTECALAELDATVADGQLESAIAAIRERGAAPPEVLEAAAAAGAACASG